MMLFFCGNLNHLFVAFIGGQVKLIYNICTKLSIILDLLITFQCVHLYANNYFKCGHHNSSHYYAMECDWEGWVDVKGHCKTVIFRAPFNWLFSRID